MSSPPPVPNPDPREMQMLEREMRWTMLEEEVADVILALDRVRCANPDLARAAIERYRQALDLHDIAMGR